MVIVGTHGIVRMDARRLKQLCWGCAIASSLLYVSPLVPALPYALEEPFNVLLGVVISLLFPAIPFFILIFHVNMRALSGRPLSVPVAVSIAVSALATFLFTAAFFVRSVLPEKLRLLPVFVIPFAAVPIAIFVCWCTWAVLALATKRGIAPLPAGLRVLNIVVAVCLAFAFSPWFAVWILRYHYGYDHGRGEAEMSMCLATTILVLLGLAAGIMVNYLFGVRRQSNRCNPSCDNQSSCRD